MGEVVMLERATTKATLLQRAKLAVEAGEGSLRAAADDLAEARERFGASQVEMAAAIGKTQSWVSRLLKWRDSAYEGGSPFGPTTKSGRDYAHANNSAKPKKSLKKQRNKKTAMPPGNVGAVPRRPMSTPNSDNNAIGDDEQTIWRRGLMFRAQTAIGDAQFEDWARFTVDRQLVEVVSQAAEAWKKLATYLEELPHGKD